MKILIASADDPDRSYGGGKHVHLRQLEASLRGLGHDVDAAFPPARPPNWDWLRTRLLWYVGGDRLLTRRNVRRLVSDFAGPGAGGYDVVNAHDVLAAAGIGGPVVLTLHGYFARELLNYGRYPAADRDAIFRDAMVIERRGMARAAAVIAVDRRIADYARDEHGVAPERIHVVHNAVDTEGFTPVDAAERARLRAGLGLAPDAFVVLVPRRLVPKNGVEFAAAALAYIGDPSLVLAVAGEGSEREAVVRAAAGDRRLRLLGGVPHELVRSWFQACDVVLVPSVPSDGVEEATSLSMLEGMSCGRAVVCSAIGGMKEVVQDGRTGLLVPPGDPTAIAAALATVGGSPDLAARLGDAGRAYAVARHSCQAHAERFVEVYRSVAAPTP